MLPDRTVEKRLLRIRGLTCRRFDLHRAGCWHIYKGVGLLGTLSINPDAVRLNIYLTISNDTDWAGVEREALRSLFARCLKVAVRLESADRVVNNV